MWTLTGKKKTIQQTNQEIHVKINKIKIYENCTNLRPFFISGEQSSFVQSFS